MEHEGIGVGPKLRNDERHALSHEPRDERNVAGETVELGYDDRALAAAGCSQGSGKLRAPVQRVGALAAFGFYERGGQPEAFLSCEASDGVFLGIYAQIAYYEYSWGDDPFARGAFGGYWTQGMWTTYGPVLRAPIGPLHWAGTETSATWNGKMEGAVASGKREAAKVMSALAR